MSEPSAVDALMADCRAVVEQIAEHKAAIAGLTMQRDVMVAELRRLGLPERAVGRLLGISGPRVNQIMNPDGDGPSAPRAARKRALMAGPDPQEQARVLEDWRTREPDGRPRKSPAVPPVVLRPPEGGSR